MALLDRVKSRIETDISDAELQLMIDGIISEIETRHGTFAAMTVDKDGGGRFIRLDPPANIAVASTITETEPAGSSDPNNQVVLATDDFRFQDGGQILQRLHNGTNGRRLWAELVTINYTPRNEDPQRDEVIIKIVQLDLNYNGLKGERAGDWADARTDDHASAD